MKRIAPLFVVFLSLFALSAKRRAVAPPATSDLKLDPERSFVITDTPVIESFTFARVMRALTAGTSTTGEQLFRQMWSTQAEPQCRELLNGYARRCPTNEARLATEPYDPEDFRPIGIINRFDQADATQCGQYSLIFASRDMMPEEALHLIFEAALPNPRPELGIAGCRPVAQFWASLSTVGVQNELTAALERFFFDGLEGFAPALHPDHFREHQAGIRTLQLTLPDPFPHFFQFRIVRENGGVIAKPDVLEDMPASALIDASIPGERGARFREVFLENVMTLAVRDANLYFMRIPPEFLVPDARPTSDKHEFALESRFAKSLGTAEGRGFEARIAEELQRIGSTLKPSEVVLRAETRSCTGCHVGGTPVGEGVIFPAALSDSQHVSEDAATGATPRKYAISPAMREVFIPHRMKILRDFLLYGKAPVHSN